MFGPQNGGGRPGAGLSNWDRYDPNAEVRSVEEFLKVVEQDKYCCFYG
ncbi:MAG: DUF3024 domain-containing protein [Proteobacteria bacterium]|nr:DUF3024 domain-containing protein [Pseudomonadota bacterium]MCH9025702.1 DUF3024 domain-containing protein [Pseudomonadota bacterium]